MSHACRFERPSEGLTVFRCGCGVAFRVAVWQGEVARVLFDAGDPRACADAIAAVERATSLKRWSFDHLMDPDFDPATGRKRVRAVAAVSSPERHACAAPASSQPTTSDVENASEASGAERVSRPLQSASPTSISLSDQDREVASDGECSSATIDDDASGDVENRPDLSGWKLLANNVDTLYVTWWNVRIAPEEVERLKAILVRSQATPDNETKVEFGGFPWTMEPRSTRRATFLLRNELARLDVWVGAFNVPTLTFYFDPHVTWSKGPRGTLDWAEAFALRVHAPETREERDARSAANGGDQDDEVPEPCMKIRRTDQAADFLVRDTSFEDAPLEEFVVRPRRRGRYFTINKDDLHASEFWSGLVHTGSTFGKGDMMLRAYNKTKEIEEQSPDKRWLYGFWQKCGACGCNENQHEPVKNPLDPDGDPIGHGRCAREGCDCASFVIDETGFMAKRPCDACGELGHVKRRVICPTCRGRGTRGRKGKKQPCHECKGEKGVERSEVQVRHKKCRGRGCDGCQRTGRVMSPLKCKKCRGKKTTTDTVWRVEPSLSRETLKEFAKGVSRTCPTCSGQGERQFTKACKTCSGDGVRLCRPCAGSGVRPRGACSACEGVGRVTCARCKGAGAFKKNKLCKRCEEKGHRLERPRPEELADPVAMPELVVATDAKGARNVGESLAIDLDSKEGYLRSLKAIWRYCVGGGQGVRGWVTWRRKTDNQQRTRWPLRDEWRAVQAVEWGEDTKDELVRVKRVKAKFERGIVQLAGFLTSAIADATELRLDDEFLFEKGCGMAWHEVGQLYERRERRRGEGLVQVVEKKRTTRALWGLLGARARREALVAHGVPVPAEEEAVA